MKSRKSIFSGNQLLGALILVTLVAVLVTVINTIPQPERVERERVKDSLHYESIKLDSMRQVRDSMRVLRYDSARRSWAEQDSLRKIKKAERQQRYDSLRAYWAEQDSLKQLRRDSARQHWDSIRARYPQKVDTLIDLNHCDTTDLMKVRGIGSNRARLVVVMRERLGGYYSPEQLTGIVPDSTLIHFTADPKDIRQLKVNHVSQNTLARHPYLTYDQAEAIYSERRRKVRLKGIEELKTLGCLTENDRIRLKYYLSFE